MGLFSFLFGNGNTNHVISESGKSIVENANAFAGFCRKIDKDASYRFPIDYTVKTDSTGDIGVFATHVSENTQLECAYDYARTGNVHFVELMQKGMAESYNLTPAELSVLQDAERFADALRSGISFYSDFLLSDLSFADFFRGGVSRVISCKRTKSFYFEITRLLGNVPMYEKNVILSDIKESLLSSYSDVKIEKDVDKKNPISFGIKF